MSIGHDPILSDYRNIATPDLSDAPRLSLRLVPVVSDGKRIREARRRVGLTQAELGQQMGVPQSVVSDWENDKLLSWRGEVDKLASKLKVNRSHFVAADESLVQTRGIEVVGEVQAGVFRIALEVPKEERVILPVMPMPAYQRLNLVALKVVGPSMDLVYPDGSFVICASSWDTDVRDGDKVVVYRARGELREATIKEVRVEPDGRVGLWPRSSHPDFQAPIYLDSKDDQDSPEIAYVVIAKYEEERRPAAPVSLNRKRA